MPIIVYVSCAEDKHVVGFEMDRATGTLREISRTEVPGTDRPSSGSLPLAVSPDRRFLYAALRTPPFPVSSFAIEDGGALRHAGQATLPDSMCSLATDRAGARLFSASYGGALLGVSAIAGGIAGAALQAIPTPPNAHCARLDPEGGFVYVACLGGDVILAQRYDGAAVDPAQHVAARTRPGAGPRHFAFARRSTRFYAVNELDGTVNAYDRDPATGALTEIHSVSALPAPAPGRAGGKVAAADIHLTPDDRFLYASERASNTLAAFRVESGTGRLGLIGHVPAEPVPRGFAIAPDGRFLLCAGLTSGQVATYAIDSATGALTRTGACHAGAGANWIEIIEQP